ncbi:MAG: hypothetical protein ACHQEM_03705 [Chitinophagales bacterium]
MKHLGLRKQIFFSLLALIFFGTAGMVCHKETPTTNNSTSTNPNSINAGNNWPTACSGTNCKIIVPDYTTPADGKVIYTVTTSDASQIPQAVELRTDKGTEIFDSYNQTKDNQPKVQDGFQYSNSSIKQGTTIWMQVCGTRTGQGSITGKIEFTDANGTVLYSASANTCN